MDITKNKTTITQYAYRNMNKIYEYILEDLCNRKAADDLMSKIDDKLEILKLFPRMNPEVEIYDGFNRKYRKINIKNYIMLYSIVDEENTIYISTMYYGKRNI